MATYNTAFGALPGYKDMVGKQPGQFMQQQPSQQNQGFQAVTARMNQQQQQQAPQQQTFSQMQQQGQARPAPPQPQPYQQYGGSQQAQQARTGMLGQLQQQLAQPTRFDTQAFQQIRQAQAANLQQEYEAQQQALNEEMARRGLMASSIAAGRYGDLAGQQARALADLDARLLQQAAETQAADRLAALQAGGQFAELAGSQDLAEFEANRVAQAQQFQEALQAAQFGEGSRQFDVEQELSRLLGIGQLTGQVGGTQTIAAGQQELDRQRLEEERRQFNIRQELERELGTGGLALDEERLELQRQQFIDDLEERRQARTQQYGISDRELNLRQTQIQNEYTQRGQEISARAARDKAEIDLAYDRLEQEAELQGRQLDDVEERTRLQNAQFKAQLEQQEAEFRRSFGLQSDRFEEEQQQFKQTFQQQYLRDLAEQTGFVHKVDANGNIVRTDQALNADVQRQLDRNLQTSLQQSEFTFRTQMENLSQVIRQSETSGIMHRLDENGNIVPVIGSDGLPVQTSAAALEQSRQQLAAAEGNADRVSREAIQRDVNSLNRETAIMRQQIELGQQTGTMWEIGPDGQLINTGRPTSQKELADKTFKLNQTIEMSQLRGMIFDPESGQFTGGETAANAAARLDRQLRLQLGMTESIGFMYNPVTNTFDRSRETVGRTSARAQAELAQQNLIVQMMQALGFGNEELIRTILGLSKPKTEGGTPSSGSGTDADGETRTGTGDEKDDKDPTNPNAPITNPTPVTNTGSPSTWGDTDPETGLPWQNGQIKVAGNGQVWRYLNGSWQPYNV